MDFDLDSQVKATILKNHGKQEPYQPPEPLKAPRHTFMDNIGGFLPRYLRPQDHNIGDQGATPDLTLMGDSSHDVNNSPPDRNVGEVASTTAVPTDVNTVEAAGTTADTGAVNIVHTSSVAAPSTTKLDVNIIYKNKLEALASVQSDASTGIDFSCLQVVITHCGGLDIQLQGVHHFPDVTEKSEGDRSLTFTSSRDKSSPQKKGDKGTLRNSRITRVAADIGGNPLRVLGFLQKTTNKPYAKAVAAEIRSNGYHKHWSQSSKRVSPSLQRRIVSLLHLVAGEQKDSLSRVAEICSAPALAVHVGCPFCFAHTVCGRKVDKVNTNEGYLHSISKWDNGALHALAIKHNKEMHATNGNIHPLPDAKMDVLDILFMSQAYTSQDHVVPAIESREWALINRQFEHHTQTYTYSDGTAPGAAHASFNANLHFPLRHTVSNALNYDNRGEYLKKLTHKCGKACIAATTIAKYSQEKKAALLTKLTDVGLDPTTTYPTEENVDLAKSKAVCLQVEYQTVKGKLDDDGCIVATFDLDPIAANVGSTQFSIGGELKWVSVNVDDLQSHGFLQLTDIARDYQDGLESVNSRSGLLNKTKDDEVWRRLSGAPLLAAAGMRAAAAGQADWRVLGLRTALYDCLRERVITNPTGVCWSYPDKGPVPKSLFFSNQVNDYWGYEATTVSIKQLESCLRDRTSLSLYPSPRVAFPGAADARVYGDTNLATVRWDILDPDVLLVFPNANTTSCSVGLEVWLLSQLSYPLAHTLESFNCTTAGDDGQVSRSNVLCLRNASLVDIPSAARRIVFVMTSNADMNMMIGKFQLRRTPTHGVVHDFNQPLKDMLKHVLDYPTSLRQQFSAYTSTMFSGSLDWVEIDHIVTLLTARWHMQPECNKGGTPARSTLTVNWVPLEVAAMYSDTSEGIIYPGGDYGQANACLTFDHALSTLSKARSNAVLSIGAWTVEASIALGLGVATYNTACRESISLIDDRLRAGAWDRLKRASWFRYAYEEWKDFQGLRDEVLSPTAYPGCELMWGELTTLGPDGSSALWLARFLGPSSLHWSWSINEVADSTPSYTGKRGSVEWRRSTFNVEWEAFAISAQLPTYHLETREEHWGYGFWIMMGHPGRTYALDRVLQRVDLLTWGDDICYKAWPNDAKLSNYSFRIESGQCAAVAKSAGWRIGSLGSQHASTQWGWGAMSHIRYWGKEGYITICIGRACMSALASTEITSGMWLSRGPSMPGIAGTKAAYQYKTLTIPNFQQENYFRRTVGVASSSTPENNPDQVNGQGTGTATLHAVSGPSHRRGPSQDTTNAPLGNTASQAQNIVTGTGTGPAGGGVPGERLKPSMGPEPKAGSTPEDADRSPDHRAASDAL